jgi:ABC-type nitrate/sulfonate/bicarbonate transport system substrate-binding protein
VSASILSRLGPLLLPLALSASMATTAAAQTVRIFSGSSPAFSPLFIADQQGFFKKEGLDVVIRPFPSGAEATEGFRSGAADLLVAADVPLLYLLSGGDAALVAPISAARDYLVIVGPKGAEAPTAFKGKRVGLVTKSSSEYLLDLFLKQSGLGLQDVERVHLSPFDQVSALVRGDVYGLSSWKPFDEKIEALAKGKFENVSWNERVGYVSYSGIVAKREYIRKNPETLQKVIRALMQAGAWLDKAGPQEASVSLAKYLRTNASDIVPVIKNTGWDIKVTPDFTNTIAQIEEFLAKQSLIKARVDWSAAYDWSALKAVSPDAVR